MLSKILPPCILPSLGSSWRMFSKGTNPRKRQTGNRRSSAGERHWGLQDGSEERSRMVAVYQIQTSAQTGRSLQRQLHWGRSSPPFPLPLLHHFNLSMECLSELVLGFSRPAASYYTSLQALLSWSVKTCILLKIKDISALTYSWELEERPGEFKGSRQQPILLTKHLLHVVIGPTAALPDALTVVNSVS